MKPQNYIALTADEFEKIARGRSYSSLPAAVSAARNSGQDLAVVLRLDTVIWGQATARTQDEYPDAE